MKRFQLLTTAIFLFCTLLIAGCTGPVSYTHLTLPTT